MTYNPLSLSHLIEAADGTEITIMYYGSGNKLSETFIPANGPATERKYYSGLEVVDGAFFQMHSKGKYVYEIGNYPSYFENIITDHLSTVTQDSVSAEF